MTDAATDAAPPAAPLAGAHKPLKTDWLHALRSLRRLLADQEDTTQVFEIMRSLNGRSTARAYHKLLASREGGRIAYERVEFSARLMDEAWLDTMPAGSVGAVYRDFVRSERLSAEGLAEISRQGVSAIDQQHPYAWLARRTRDVHDLWHILAGYGRDGLGEGCLVAFSYSQTKGLGWALIAAGVAMKAGRLKTYPYVRAIREGYARGKSAAWLLGEDYERLMFEPLEAARQRLKLPAPATYDAIPPHARNQAIAGH